MNQSSNDPVLELINDPDTPPEQKLELLIGHVQDHGSIPRGTEWLWLQGASVAISEDPFLLALFDRLEPPLLSGLLARFLGTKPGDAEIRGACDALLAVCGNDRSKRMALAAFLDHPFMAGRPLLSLLGASRALRERCFDYYPSGTRALPGRLRAILDDLPHDPPTFRQALDVVLDAKRLLPDDQKRIAGWRNARKQLQQLNQLQKSQPGLVAKITGQGRRRKQLDGIGAPLAEAAVWAMPGTEFPSDVDGTQRAELLGDVAGALLDSGELPEGFTERMAVCFAGHDWVSLASSLVPTVTLTPDDPVADEARIEPDAVDGDTVSETSATTSDTIPVPPVTVKAPFPVTATSPVPRPPPPVPPPLPQKKLKRSRPMTSQTLPPPPKVVAVPPPFPKVSPGPKASPSPDESVPQSAGLNPLLRWIVPVVLCVGFLGYLGFRPGTPALESLLAESDTAERAALFLSLTEDDFATLTTSPDYTPHVDLLAGIADSLSDEQWRQDLSPDRRVALLTAVLAQDGVVAPARQLELVLQAEAVEQIPILTSLTSAQLLRMLVESPGPVRRELLARLTNDEWGEAIHALLFIDFRNLVSSLTPDELACVPEKHLAALPDEEYVATLLSRPGTTSAETLTGKLKGLTPKQLGIVFEKAAPANLTLFLAELNEADTAVQLEKLTFLGRPELIERFPDANVNRLSNVRLAALMKDAGPDVLSVVLGKLTAARRVSIVLGLPRSQQRKLATLDASTLRRSDTLLLMAAPEKFAQLLDVYPEARLAQIRTDLALTTSQRSALGTHSARLATFWGTSPIPPHRPVPFRASASVETNPEGQLIVYSGLPDIPTNPGEMAEVVLGRVVPQEDIRSLALHGIQSVSRAGTAALGPTLKRKRTKDAFELVVDFDSRETGTTDEPFCRFWVDATGALKFTWQCEDRPELTRAIAMFRCSVLEIQHGRESELFVSFLKPMKIPARQSVDATRSAIDRVSWSLPEKEPLLLTGWPLLLGGLSVHVPTNGKQYSPSDDGLRNKINDLETLQSDHTLTSALLSSDRSVSGISGVSVPIIAFKVVSPTNEQREKATASLRRERDLLKRTFAKAVNARSPATAIAGLRAVANLLGLRAPPTKGDGKPVPSIDYARNLEVWATRTVFPRAEARLSEIATQLKSAEDSPSAASDTILKSGLTISGDIHRVVGVDWDESTTGTQWKGGIIVKAFEIADQDPELEP